MWDWFFLAVDSWGLINFACFVVLLSVLAYGSFALHGKLRGVCIAFFSAIFLSVFLTPILIAPEYMFFFGFQGLIGVWALFCLVALIPPYPDLEAVLTVPLTLIGFPFIWAELISLLFFGVNVLFIALFLPEIFVALIDSFLRIDLFLIVFSIGFFWVFYFGSKLLIEHLQGSKVSFWSPN